MRAFSGKTRLREAVPGASLYFLLIFEAARNLALKPMRSLLTLLGVAVGSGVVIALLNIGANARAEALRQFESVGIDYVTISPSLAGGERGAFQFEEVAQMPLAWLGLEGAAPLIPANEFMAIGQERAAVQIVGAPPELQGLIRLEVSAGRFLSNLDGREPFVVLGAGIAAKAVPKGALVLGEPVRIGANMFRVIGVLRHQALNPLNSVDPDNSAFVGIAAIERAVSPRVISRIVGRIAVGADPETARDRIRAYFRRDTRPDGVQVSFATDLIDSVNRQMRIYTALLLAVGVLSLTVSGVGIMNVMLIGVAERQTEIGLRAALGASASAIRAMFLFEALALSVLGTLFGAIIGLFLAVAFAEYSGWTFQLSPSVFPLGLGVALAVGLFSGSYPAHRAASVDPIQALRSRA